MIAVDTNILVYAHRGESVFHAEAFRCLTGLAEGARAWAIPDACIHEFLAVVTNPRVFTPASTTSQALAQVNAWLASPSVEVLYARALHWDTLSRLAIAARLMGGQFHDARIAAICIENGVSEFWTADRDFSRFPELNTHNPLLHQP